MRTEERNGKVNVWCLTGSSWVSRVKVFNMIPAKLSRSSRILPNLKRGEDELDTAVTLPLLGFPSSLCVFPPDSVVEVEVFLSELGLGAQRQVDLHVAVLHPLGWKVVLRLRQHGRQRHSLCHGLLVVTAHEITEHVTAGGRSYTRK